MFIDGHQLMNSTLRIPARRWSDLEGGQSFISSGYSLHGKATHTYTNICFLAPIWCLSKASHLLIAASMAPCTSPSIPSHWYDGSSCPDALLTLAFVFLVFLPFPWTSSSRFVVSLQRLRPILPMHLEV